MKKYNLHLRYIYTFYSDNDILSDEVFDELIPITDTPSRFTLHLQEEGNFIISEIKQDYKGDFALLTMPNKESRIVRPDEDCELEYDESDGVNEGDRNVYEGSVTLEEAE